MYEHIVKYIIHLRHRYLAKFEEKSPFVSPESVAKEKTVLGGFQGLGGRLFTILGLRALGCGVLGFRTSGLGFEDVGS